MVKKATATATQTQSAAEQTDLVDLKTLKLEFKLGYETVVKIVEEAGIKPAYSRPFGKGVLSLYNRKEITPIFEAKVAAKKKLAEERERKAAAKKGSTTEASDATPSAVSASVLSMMTELGAKMNAQQDITSKQFELLSMKLGAMEKAIGAPAEKPSNVAKDVVEAIKPILTDSLTASSSSMRRLREENEKAFAAHALATEAGFTRVCQQIDAVLARVNHMAELVAGLEHTILSIATAPSVNLTSGEASKAQDFFRESSEAVGGGQVTQASQTSADEKDVQGNEAGHHQRVVLQKRKKTGTGVEQPVLDAKGAGETGIKPRVLILGLHDNKVRHIDSFKAKLDMTIFNPDEATTRMGQTPPKTDYTIQLIDYISHTVGNKVANGTESILVTGGLSSLRRELNKIVRKGLAN